MGQSLDDSLSDVLKRPDLNDTLRVDILNKLAWNLKHKTPEQSLLHAQEALKLSQKVKYLRGEAEALNQIGINHAIMGDYPEALKNFLTSLPIWDAAGEIALRANTLNNIGNVHQLQGNIDEAKDFFKEALKFRLMVRDTASIFASYNSIAILFKDQSQFDSALFYFREFLRLARIRNDIRRISISSNNIGLVYRNQEKYDSALIFFNDALKIKQQIKDEQGMALSYRNIGDVYNELGDIGKALEYYKTSLAIRERIGYNLGLTVLLKDIASMLMKSGQLAEAEKYGKQSLSVARKSKMKLEESEVLKTLSAILTTRNDFRGALQYHHEYTALKDSLFNAEKSKQLNELQVQYETEQKEKELLAKNKAIEILEIQAAGDERLKIILIVAALLLTGLVGLLYNRYKLKKRSEEEVSRKNKEIEQKNSEIETINKELEKRMLRAQMDPHFIFNCLNGIQHFITTNDKDSALKFLSKFSKLVRQVLENSVNTIVPLADEIRLLELYIELEALRFEHRFEHAIEIDPALDLQNVEVPFLLIQPYVENAIQHGLRHRSAGGKLFIRLTKLNGSVHCTVEDNGIGRRQASSMKSGDREAHHSRGMSLTEQRLELLNKKHSRKTLVAVEDLDATELSGTKVTITIPNEYD